MKKSYKWLFWLFLLMLFCVNVDKVYAKNFTFRNLEVDLNAVGKYKTNCTLNITNGKVGKCDCDAVKIEISGGHLTYSVRCNRNLFSSNLNGSSYEVTNFDTKFISGPKKADGTINQFIEITKFTLKSKEEADCDKEGVSCGKTPEYCKNFTNKDNYKSVCEKATSFDDMMRLCEESTDILDFYKICAGEKKDPEYIENKKAESVEEIKKWAEEQESLSIDDGISKDNVECSELFGGGLADIIKNLIFILSVIGVILLVILVSMDFISAITSSEEGIADAWKKSKIRILATVILLLLPVLTGFIIDVINNNLYLDENNNLKVGNVSECLGETSNS